MPRQPSTNESNSGFDERWINAVWSKANIVPGYDANLYRKDVCGAWIERKSYGTTTKWGWEIDHVFPVSQGGNDALTNLQPLHWQNNRGKGDTVGAWSCTVGAN